jgi:hypothetical protein
LGGDGLIYLVVIGLGVCVRFLLDG